MAVVDVSGRRREVAVDVGVDPGAHARRGHRVSYTAEALLLYAVEARCTARVAPSVELGSAAAVALATNRPTTTMVPTRRRIRVFRHCCSLWRSVDVKSRWGETRGCVQT